MLLLTYPFVTDPADGIERQEDSGSSQAVRVVTASADGARNPCRVAGKCAGNLNIHTGGLILPPPATPTSATTGRTPPPSPSPSKTTSTSSPAPPASTPTPTSPTIPPTTRPHRHVELGNLLGGYRRSCSHRRGRRLCCRRSGNHLERCWRASRLRYRCCDGRSGRLGGRRHRLCAVANRPVNAAPKKTLRRFAHNGGHSSVQEFRLRAGKMGSFRRAHVIKSFRCGPTRPLAEEK
jgi:hypothetical protein